MPPESRWGECAVFGADAHAMIWAANLTGSNVFGYAVSANTGERARGVVNTGSPG